MNPCHEFQYKIQKVLDSMNSISKLKIHGPGVHESYYIPKFLACPEVYILK
jgi:hypothetical protein